MGEVLKSEYPNDGDIEGWARYVIDQSCNGNWKAYGEMVDVCANYGVDYLDLNRHINNLVGEKIYPEE
jgi:hypothetical protein